MNSETKAERGAMRCGRWVVLTVAIIGWALAGCSFEQGQKTQVERQQSPQTFSRPTLPSLSSVPSRPAPRPPYPSVIAILCYHDLAEKGSRYSVTPQQFEAHLKTLRANGFTFLTVSELVSLLDGKWDGAIPRRVVAITLDDGFRSAYTVAFPLLRKYQAKATLFVYTNWVAKTKKALTWAQLREMAQSGLVEIASHTVTHAYPKRLRRALRPEAYRQRWLWELQTSKQALEQQLGITVRGLAYPGGQVDDTLKHLAQQVGYQWAVTINPKPVTPQCDRYALPRFGIDRTISLRQVLAWLQRASKPSRHAQRWNLIGE
jgi:peptidoglycan/xylan/chitin deacetylase (PgdA/CDA1 family)